MNSFFRVSERNHLGLILMAELSAAFPSHTFIRLPMIASRMRVPLGYLEEVALSLKAAGLVEGRRGRSGGYRLAVAPKNIAMDRVLTALEGPIALVPCQNKDTDCPATLVCSSRSLWRKVQMNLLHTLKRTTLADLA